MSKSLTKNKKPKSLVKKPAPAIPRSPVDKNLQPKYTGLVRGSPDPNRPECVLVPLNKAPRHPVFRDVATKYAPPQTFYRYDKAEKRVLCLVSVMSNGLHVAWDTCGGCAWYWSLCKCAAGLRSPRSVEYIFDQINALAAGQEWDHNHPHYRGSFTRAERLARASRMESRYASTKPWKPPVPAQAAESPSGGRTATQVAPRRLSKATRKGTDASAVFDAAGGLDMGKLDDAAAAMAVSLSATKKLTKVINKTSNPGKRLVKRGK